MHELINIGPRLVFHKKLFDNSYVAYFDRQRASKSSKGAIVDARLRVKAPIRNIWEREPASVCRMALFKGERNAGLLQTVTAMAGVVKSRSAYNLHCPSYDSIRATVACNGILDGTAVDACNRRQR